MGILQKLFQKFFQKKCQHNWQIEQPTHDIGGLMVWEGPVKDYCTKCGARRPHPECKHKWQPVEDDGKGCYIDGIKQVRTHICSKCGTTLYEKPG